MISVLKPFSNFFANVSLVERTDFSGFAVLAVFLSFIGIFVQDATQLSLLTIGLVWLSVNKSWNLVLGYAGIFSFGQVAFFASGAYVSGILNYHLGISPYVTLLAAPFGGATAALFIGFAAVKLRGVYVALVTLAFHELLRTLISTDYSGLTGGPNGLQVAKFLPGASLLAQARVDYFVAVSIFFLTGGLVLKLLSSPFGLALVATRDAENVATARGVNRQWYQLCALIISGAIAGLAGGFYAHYVGVVAPTIISFALVMNLFAMIIVGGIGTFWGPIVGTVSVTLLTTYLQGTFPQHQSLIVASILVVMVLFLPTGLVGLTRSIVLRLGRANDRQANE